MASFADVKHLIYFSDDCAGQYKNKKNFLDLYLHECDFGMSAEWHFFTTGHGKGPSNWIGGTIKKEATKASFQWIFAGQILSPVELHEFVTDHLHGINSEFVTNENWDQESELSQERFNVARKIAGT